LRLEEMRSCDHNDDLGNQGVICADRTGLNLMYIHALITSKPHTTIVQSFTITTIRPILLPRARPSITTMKLRVLFERPTILDR
jgi:hypothetical protein